MKGKLYGIGVGPGDPELLTLKALRVITNSDVIAIPSKDRESCVSYGIVKEVYPEIEKMECIFLDYPMTKEKQTLEQSHKQNEEKVIKVIETGKNIAFLTLGDPTIYSTYLYLHKRIKEAGYETEIISGIPSFCAIAADLGISLGEAEEEIHIIPVSYGIPKTFELPGTKILMKAGNKLKEIKEIGKERDCLIAMVENCGMENQKIAVGMDNIDDTAGYYTTVIMKDKGRNKS